MVKIKTDLVKRDIASYIASNIDDFEMDLNAIADTRATRMIEEIHWVLNNIQDDFEIVEKIVCIFENYGVAVGGCHDF